jgi:LETM1 and EF-hand domain-containing protein 1
MRSIGITQFRLKAQLQEWLQLSTHKNIPISLLIMSRAFSLTTSDDPEEVLKSSMSSLDSDTINEVVVASASAGEENTVDVKKRKIESLKFQEELIEEEIENKEEKQKKEKEKEAAAAAAAAAQIKVELKGLSPSFFLYVCAIAYRSFGTSL